MVLEACTLVAILSVMLVQSLPIMASSPVQKEKKVKVITEDTDIEFKDPMVKELCLQQWGHDGRFTYADAARVTSMGEQRHEEMKYDDTSFVFDEIEVSDRPHAESFNELRFFRNLTNIDSYSFTQCDQLREITLPENVKNIGDMAFVFCTSLEKIYIPDNVESIARRAFTGCTSLREISLPEGVELGKDVFTHCHPDLKIIWRKR